MDTEKKTAEISKNGFDSLQGKRLILVVDDDFTNREILGEILRQDYDVLYAENGMEAMQQIRSHHDTLSLILLDLLMPVMSGQEVLRQIGENAELSRIPVIVFTADQKSEVECLSLGAIDFIPKPYPQPDVILARVQRTIELFEDRRIIRSTERDGLTGLYSKEYFFRYSEQFDIQHRDIAMDAIVVDINHFHILNERYGKSFCDDLLKRIGEKVRESILETGGIVSRKEADTFLIYCPHRSDYEDMLDLFTVELGNEGGSSRVHVRMGVYENADKNIEVERRFDRAKTAADMVHGSFTKAIGFYDEDLNDRELFAEQLIENFRNALEEKQFRVFFQPKYDISPHKPILTSAEALVRWDHPVLGMVSPGKFIPLFESNGLIQQLDHFVWQETARQIREWKDRLGYAVPVSVNVSRVDLYEEDVVGTLLNIVESNGLQPNDLLLEVTESSYTENFSQIIGKVNELRKHGFRIEMDDFGTGYSSLNLISSLPIDAIKLDMGFIREAFKEGGSTRMIEIIIDIAAFLNVPTIAEGVETEDQCKALRLMGCDIVQGYYFSKPLPADVFETFLLEGKKAKAELEAFREEEKATAKAKRDEEINAMRRSDAEKVKNAETADVSLKQKKIGGIPMRIVNFVLAVLAVIVAVSLYIADGNVNRSYQAAVDASGRYSNAQQAAFLMETVSDYLTYQVRSFVINGDLRAMENYFEEINVTRRREQALSDVQHLLGEGENSAYSSLALALDHSNELAERELTAMRLLLESDGYTGEEIPPELAGVELSDEYLSLSPAEQHAQAVNLVFDDVYMDYKEKINANVGSCTEELLLKSKQDVDNTSARMFRQLRFQSVLTTVLLVTVLVLIFLQMTQVQKPLADLVLGMRNQKKVKPIGAKEMRFVSQTYNDFLEESQKARAQLTYEAAHDPLTGLFNRNAYDLLVRSVDQKHIAMLLFDVDRFRKITDIYGQETGSRVLQRVASVLKGNFRSVDLIFRMDDDLFVVIMTRVNNSMSEIVVTKFLQINKMLHEPQGELPGISVSLGAAFSDRADPQGDIYEDAQAALDKAKAAGTKICEIY